MFQCKNVRSLYLYLFLLTYQYIRYSFSIFFNDIKQIDTYSTYMYDTCIYILYSMLGIHICMSLSRTDPIQYIIYPTYLYVYTYLHMHMRICACASDRQVSVNERYIKIATDIPIYYHRVSLVDREDETTIHRVLPVRLVHPPYVVTVLPNELMYREM